MADSISRQFARWAANLSYEDLPPAVVDKVKALILVHLVSGVFGGASARGREAVDLILAEEGKPDGATVLGHGGKATRIGATYANAEMMKAEEHLEDSYRMITHPGGSLVPAAIVNAELGHRSMKDVIVALAVGYELSCRLANDFVPSTAARGFRPAPIFATMGTALTTAKLMGLDEDGLVAAIALATNGACGLFEAGLEGGGETSVQDPNAARAGVFAAMIASQGRIKGSELAIEGPSGFYHAFTGSNTGKLTYAFTGPLQVDLASITEGLGSRYELLTIMFRMYNTGGYNHQVINLMAELKQQHHIDAAEIEEVAVTMNWLETLYPSPAFRDEHAPLVPAVRGTHYFAAHAAVNGGFPVVGERSMAPDGAAPEKDERVLEFMRTRVRIIPEKGRPMFSPAITVTMKDGKTHSGEFPYARMEWNFDQLVPWLQRCVPEFPLGQAGMDRLVAMMRDADQLPSVAPLFEATQATAAH